MNESSITRGWLGLSVLTAVIVTSYPSTVLAGDCSNAGVFAYARHEGQVTILLGRDSQTGYWADFVGKRERKSESCADIAAREFTEETRGAYSSVQTVKDLRHARQFRSGDTIIFLREVQYIDAGVLGNLPEIAKTTRCFARFAIS